MRRFLAWALLLAAIFVLVAFIVGSRIVNTVSRDQDRWQRQSAEGRQ